MEDVKIICDNCDGQGCRNPDRSRARCSHCDGNGELVIGWREHVKREGSLDYAIELLEGADQENVAKRKEIERLTDILTKVRNELEARLQNVRVNELQLSMLVTFLNEVLDG